MFLRYQFLQAFVISSVLALTVSDCVSKEKYKAMKNKYKETNNKKKKYQKKFEELKNNCVNLVSDDVLPDPEGGCVTAKIGGYTCTCMSKAVCEDDGYEWHVSCEGICN